jgi:hypothetical protein
MSATNNLRRRSDDIFLEKAKSDGRMVKGSLSMKDLGDLDLRYQCRVDGLKPEHLVLLRGYLESQGELAHIVVFRATRGEETRLIVADGFHRHECYRLEGRALIPAIVIDSHWDTVEHEAMDYATMPKESPDEA